MKTTKVEKKGFLESDTSNWNKNSHTVFELLKRCSYSFHINSN